MHLLIKKPRIVFDIGIFAYFMITLFFFPPKVIETVETFKTINLLFYYLRILISVLIFIGHFITSKSIKKKSLQSLFTIVLFFFCIEISNVLNGSKTIISDAVMFFTMLSYLTAFIDATSNKICKFYKGASLYCFLLCVFNLLSIIYLPNGFARGVEHDWQAQYLLGNSNSFIFFFIFSSFVIIQAVELSDAKNRSLIWIFLVVILTSSLLAESSACIIGTISIVCTYVFSFKKTREFFTKHGFKIIILIIAFVIWIVFLDGWKSGFIMNFVTNQINEEANFLSRTGIWSTAVSVISKKPIVGYGTENFKFSYYISTAYGITSAHDNFLQILYYGGVLSLFAYLLMIFSLLKSKYYNDKNNHYFALAFTILYLVVYIVEQNPFYLGFYIILLSNRYKINKVNSISYY